MRSLTWPLYLWLVLTQLLGVAARSTHTVSVGSIGSFYDPPTATAEEGDTIRFIFSAGRTHSVTESSLENPCVPLPGGFDSGLIGPGKKVWRRRSPGTSSCQMLRNVKCAAHGNPSHLVFLPSHHSLSKPSGIFAKPPLLGRNVRPEWLANANFPAIGNRSFRKQQSHRGDLLRAVADIGSFSALVSLRLISHVILISLAIVVQCVCLIHVREHSWASPRWHLRCPLRHRQRNFVGDAGRRKHDLLGCLQGMWKKLVTDTPESRCRSDAVPERPSGALSPVHGRGASIIAGQRRTFDAPSRDKYRTPWMKLQRHTQAFTWNVTLDPSIFEGVCAHLATKCGKKALFSDSIADVPWSQHDNRRTILLNYCMCCHDIPGTFVFDGWVPYSIDVLGLFLPANTGLSRWVLALLWLPCVLFWADVARGQATHLVTVGTSGSFYDPPTVSAQKGDVVRFLFTASFANPCLPLPGGFSSGLIGPAINTSAPTLSWDLIVADDSQRMAGVINPPSNALWDTFISAAKAVSGTPSPTPGLVLTGVGAYATSSPTAVLALSSTPSSDVTAISSLSVMFATSTSASGSTSSSSSGQKTPLGPVIGGVVGGVAAVSIIIVLSVLLYRAKRTSRTRNPSGGNAADMLEKEYRPDAYVPPSSANRALQQRVAPVGFVQSAPYGPQWTALQGVQPSLQSPQSPPRQLPRPPMEYPLAPTQPNIRELAHEVAALLKHEGQFVPAPLQGQDVLHSHDAIADNATRTSIDRFSSPDSSARPNVSGRVSSSFPPQYEA
ncbi:hypothetical protein GLOTRDRAFT_93283 [Gloeophyllum trabeum ATCC 11539]|uniref:Plastocyanin-like domain-containing protein n=1 Tax=Gloeophyllum trabeum (strain ATCC 11539 / FP-39264 / Madison 617) TaxID=670483 RepID=S7RMN1_GLOTA|nr:uncharacterized protein GLOTRDRAFT_93283 [Gloeophyllum trabeum ATCC 11539]EPQ55710.1 hypothetical protein GLOTRDRAFT_93283 [Gloeophyllum trabeum ATCC 11539]